MQNDGHNFTYKVQLFRCAGNGSYSEARGKTHRVTVEWADIILVGIQLTRKTSKLSKGDLDKIIRLLNHEYD